MLDVPESEAEPEEEPVAEGVSPGLIAELPSVGLAPLALEDEVSEEPLVAEPEPIEEPDVASAPPDGVLPVEEELGVEPERPLDESDAGGRALLLAPGDVAPGVESVAEGDDGVIMLEEEPAAEPEAVSAGGAAVVPVVSAES